MTGNDIVDLDRLSHHAYQLSTNYLNKITTPAEQDLIYEYHNPQQMLAAIWAAKESVYKIYNRYTQHKGFIPKQLIVALPKEEQVSTLAIGGDTFQLSVSTPAGKFAVTIYLYPKCVHAVCFDRVRAFKKLSGVCPLPYSQKQPNSQYLKKIVCQILRSKFPQISPAITIQKDEKDIPYFSTSDRKWDIPLSLSHDGNWGGYSLVVRAEI